LARPRAPPPPGLAAAPHRARPPRLFQIAFGRCGCEVAARGQAIPEAEAPKTHFALGGRGARRLAGPKLGRVEPELGRLAAARARGRALERRAERRLADGEDRGVPAAHGHLGPGLARRPRRGHGQDRERARHRVLARARLPDAQDVRGGQCGHGAQLERLRSAGSGTSTSRSQPSFSSLMCWMATALAFESRSGSAWYSETQQRYTL